LINLVSTPKSHSNITTSTFISALWNAQKTKNSQEKENHIVEDMY
jgi:hypothetical protein